ncbi:MAG: hypothetical protein JW857_10445 [Bacteroidales bacterium]|nr:hypothetical protein [Bacteroidales bacterium]
MLNLEIKPRVGLGNILFGEIPENLTKIMGKPETVEDVRTDDDLKTTILSFPEKGITVFLEGLIEPIVSNFDVDNKSATLFGVPIFEKSEAQVKQLMEENGYATFEDEEEEWGERRLTCEDALMDFYFVDGKLQAVNWGVYIKEDGTIDKDI